MQIIIAIFIIVNGREKYLRNSPVTHRYVSHGIFSLSQFSTRGRFPFAVYTLQADKPVSVNWEVRVLLVAVSRFDSRRDTLKAVLVPRR